MYLINPRTAMRMVDPHNDSGAFESFAYKQLFFEPIVEGGLFTAAAPALIARFGLGGMLLITGSLLVFWLGMGAIIIKQNKRKQRSPQRQKVLH